MQLVGLAGLAVEHEGDCWPVGGGDRGGAAGWMLHALVDGRLVLAPERRVWRAAGLRVASGWGVGVGDGPVTIPAPASGALRPVTLAWLGAVVVVFARGAAEARGGTVRAARV